MASTGHSVAFFSTPASVNPHALVYRKTVWHVTGDGMFLVVPIRSERRTRARTQTTHNNSEMGHPHYSTCTQRRCASSAGCLATDDSRQTCCAARARSLHYLPTAAAARCARRSIQHSQFSKILEIQFSLSTYKLWALLFWSSKFLIVSKYYVVCILLTQMLKFYDCNFLILECVHF
jgi:hypothetical protein